MRRLAALTLAIGWPTLAGAHDGGAAHLHPHLDPQSALLLVPVALIAGAWLYARRRR